MSSSLSPREELASIAAAVRAYLEWQQDTGALGIPRRPKPPRAADPAAAAQREGAAAPARARGAAEGALPGVTTPTFEAPVEPPLVAQAANTAQPAPPTAGGAVGVAAAGTSRRSLQVIEEEVRGCRKCGLAATRTNTVFSRGNPESQLCFIGEAPGADEDAQGLPFVGRAGQLLDRMIAAMGLDPKKDVYICNIIKCRPPGNRRPEPNETEACIPYLHEQLDIVEPKVIVALGNTAVASLIGTKLGITKLRGQWKLYRGRIPIMPTYHPSYLLRPSPQQAEAKRQAWEDLQAVMKELGLPPRPSTRRS
jgi:uracil-DNA glycosylase family 4